MGFMSCRQHQLRSLGVVVVSRSKSKRSASSRETRRKEERRKEERAEELDAERHRDTLSQAKKLGIAAIAVTAVGLIVTPLFLWLNYRGARTEGLQVQAWSVGYTVQDETVTEPAEPSKAPVTRPANVTTLDLAFRNRGAVASLITATKLVVTDAVQPGYCAAIGGGLEVADAYDVVLPGISAQIPFDLVREQLFTVEAGANDRYQILMAADAALEDAVSFIPTAYSAHVSIQHDNGDDIDVGSVAFLSPPYKLADSYRQLDYSGGAETLAQCLATAGRTLKSVLAGADRVASDLVCYADLYERAGNALESGSSLPIDSCEEKMSSLDRLRTSGTASNESSQAETICLTPCNITGEVPFAHPTWGDSTLVTTQSVSAISPGTQIYQSQIVVVDASGVVQWRHRAGDWHEIAPAETPIDETDHIFLNYNPGRYNGVIILDPIHGGFRDFDTLPEPGDFAQRFYSAQLYDVDADGTYEVRSEINTCRPSCADANYELVTFVWNGQDYESV